MNTTAFLNLNSIFKKMLIQDCTDSFLSEDKSHSCNDDECVNVTANGNEKPFKSHSQSNVSDINLENRETSCNVEQIIDESKDNLNPSSVTSWKELLSADISKKEKVLKVIEFLNSSGALYETKDEILAFLSEECKSDFNLYGVLGSSQYVYYAEKLLMKFCETFLKNVPDSDTKELKFLTSVLMLLIPISNMSVQMINSTFLVQSDFLYKLMHAISLCSHNMITTLKKLRKLTMHKNLTCVKFLMDSTETKVAFENCFNINLRSLANSMLGYKLLLFDTVDDTLERNINEEIIQTQPIVSCVQANPEETIDDKERSNVELIRIFPLKHALVYTDNEWREYLVNISAKIHKVITQQKISCTKPNNKLQKGDTVGFCSHEATFEGEAILMVPYLRGEVLSVIGHYSMVWAMDIGLLSYIPSEKLHILKDVSLISESPLVSIGILQGPICNYDQEFLEVAHALLKGILKTNAQHGKHMFLSDMGEDILIFAEFPNGQIRLHFLDIICNLANNCEEVRIFLEKQKFDTSLADKLVRYAHCYGSELCENRALFRIEMIVMTKILTAVFEEKTDIKNWTGNQQAMKAFKMLLDDPDIQWRHLFKNCLKQLDGRPVSGFQEPCRSGGGSWKENYKQGSYRPHFRRNGGGSWRENSRQDTHRPLFKGSGNEWKEDCRQEYNRHNVRGGGTDSRENRRQDMQRTHFSRNNIQNPHMSRDRNNHDICYQPYEECLNTTLENEVKTVHDEEKSLSVQMDYLIRGSKVDAQCDQTHHLMQEKAIHDIQEMKLAQVLCGLLNNNIESYMYFGITEDSLVEGMLLTRDNKDVFRNGVDRTMSKSLLPEVQVTSYDIIFTPVVKAGDTAINSTKKCLYVIEIRIRPLRHMAYALHQCRKCYIRQGAETLESTITQKKNYMIEMEEKALEETTNSIREVSKGHLSILATFVKKYLPKEVEETQ